MSNDADVNIQIHRSSSEVKVQAYKNREKIKTRVIPLKSGNLMPSA